jgi:hypothetical protein
MAVADNVGAKIGSSSQNLDNNNNVVSSDSAEVEKSKPRTDQDVNNNGVFNHQHQERVPNGNYGFKTHQMGQMHANGVQNQQFVVNNDGYVMNGNGGESFKREMRDLEELLSKLNPMAEEFVPPSLANNQGYLAAGPAAGFGYPPNNFILLNNYASANGQTNRRVWIYCFDLFHYFLVGSWCHGLTFFFFLIQSCVLQRKNGFTTNGKRRVNHKVDMEKREEMIRRTVYVSDIDQLVGI